MDAFDDVAAYLVLAPLVIVVVAAAIAIAVWALRRRPTAVGVKRTRISR